MADSSRASVAPEDWDHSETDMQRTRSSHIVFPSHGSEASNGEALHEGARGGGKRTLSELLKLHAEKGTDVNFSPEEAARVADVLNQWINSESSPYEGDDDFFARTQDDLSISRRSSTLDASGRPRGQSESVIRKS